MLSYFWNSGCILDGKIELMEDLDKSILKTNKTRGLKSWNLSLSSLIQTIFMNFMIRESTVT